MISHPGFTDVTQRNGWPASSTRRSAFMPAWKSSFRRATLYVVWALGCETMAFVGSTSWRASAAWSTSTGSFRRPAIASNALAAETFATLTLRNS